MNRMEDYFKKPPNGKSPPTTVAEMARLREEAFASCDPERIAKISGVLTVLSMMMGCLRVFRDGEEVEDQHDLPHEVVDKVLALRTDSARWAECIRSASYEDDLEVDGVRYSWKLRGDGKLPKDFDMSKAFKV